MNFLAHAYLAKHSIALTIGNFIADFVKGNAINGYDNDIKNGIIMHRQIDSYTDNHEVFKRSRQRITNKYHHYSGVIIDIFYDHFLAKNWDTYSNMPLIEFTEKLYTTINNHRDILPEKANYMLPFMIDKNWLYNYSFIEGIDKSLKGLSKRTSFKSNMEDASLELIKHYDQFDQDFKDFFPDIIKFTKTL